MRPRLPWSLLALASLLVVLAVGFSALALWQVQRLGWKNDLTARVQARTQAAPSAAPLAAAWPDIARNPKAYEYRRVQLSGRYRHEAEVQVQALTELGSGYWVLTPLVLDSGTLVWVNRGFVPPQQRNPAARQAALPTGPVTITGLLRTTEPGGGFLRRNDAAAGRWYSRDIAAISAARALPLPQVAPYFVDRERGPPADTPVGGLTVLTFTNNHLIYAITWAALALMTLAALVYLLRHPRQPRQ